MVLKPESDCTVRLEKSRTSQFCDSFNFKNHSMKKKQDPMQTAVGPHDSKNREWFSQFSQVPF